MVTSGCPFAGTWMEPVKTGSLMISAGRSRIGSAVAESTRGIRLERDGAVASIVLDSPPLNLFNDDVFAGLVECLDELEAADDVRCAVWRAEGEIFTGGVDVNLFQRLVDAGDHGAQTFGQLLGPVRRLDPPKELLLLLRAFGCLLHHVMIV